MHFTDTRFSVEELLNQIHHLHNQLELLRRDSIKAQSYLDAFSSENALMHQFLTDSKLDYDFRVYKENPKKWNERRAVYIEQQEQRQKALPEFATTGT